MSCVDGICGTLAGRYELAEVIGRGGMGTVYRATDLVLGRAVAVKVLAAALVEEDPSFVVRFEREARSAASLAHPGVVTVYDTGADNGTRFIVMEYVAGHNLAAIIGEEAPLEPERAVRIAERVADALSAAHAAGIVHRDIKPANVMVGEDGSVKVLDFGIARLLDGTTLTQTNTVLGSTAYMAPEQALGERVDERSDIYSLGCVLYAMLGGQPPFTGEASAAVLHQHVNVEPRSLRASSRRVSPALDRLVMQMLAKSPDARPRSAGEVRGRLGAQQGESPTTETMRHSPTARLDRTTATRVMPRDARAKRRLVATSVIGGALLLIAVVVLAAGGGARNPAHAGRLSGLTAKRTAAPGSQTSTARSGVTTTSAPRATSTDTAPAVTVSGAAGALTALVSQNVESGSIDQQAGQQITNGLAAILNSYETGHTMDVAHKLADLSQKLTTLERHADVSTAAAAPLNTAVNSLNSALATSTPQTPIQGDRPTPPAVAPPGQANKPGGPHGEKHGD